MGLQIDWGNQIVEITSPTISVDMQVLHNFIEDEMASPRGMTEADIINPEGKIEDPSNPGVFSQIIVILNSPWQIQFWSGSGYTRIYGGKLVGGLADEPLKATGTAGDISVLESPVDGLAVVVETGTSGLTSEESQALIDIADDQSTIQGDIGTVQTDMAFMKAIEDGEWKIENNQMIFYNALSVEVFRVNLFDRDGNPTMENVYRRVPV